MGRRKIEMKMVKDSSSRQVTFSKRRTGLFKKANELATLCAAEVAIVAFSPGGKPFSFGNPSVHSVTQRFLNQDRPNDDCHTVLEELNGQLSDLQKQIQIEQQKGELLDKALKGMNLKPIHEMSMDELFNMKQALEELRENMKRRMGEMEASSSLLLLSKNPTQGN